MDRPTNLVLAIVVVVLILGLIAFARGEPRHGEPTAPPAAMRVVGVAT
jgi:hypothetical protein